MSEHVITMATPTEEWMSGRAKIITFSVTEDCNLRCTYCYMTHKKAGKRMSLDTACAAVDYILDAPTPKEEAVIWEFVGGEPFLEVELIDKVADYIKLQLYKRNHPWFSKYRFSITTNGLLYDTDAVQRFIAKNWEHVSVSITVDGNKTKHDGARVKCDGSGSYEDIIQNVPLWQDQFPGHSTKATFSSVDLPHLKDSIISLWNLGINHVNANVVFEDVWKEGDDILFETQLNELGDCILKNGLWKDNYVRFFDHTIGFPLLEREKQANWCGAGKMLAIDHKGDFFPCIRFTDFSLNKHPGISIGNAQNGINKDRLRPFLALNLENQSTEECRKCDVATGCSLCVGCSYDCADTPTIFQRATHKCKMHKANVRAVEKFWNSFEEKTGIPSPRRLLAEKRAKWLHSDINARHLIIIEDDSAQPHCHYLNPNSKQEKMSLSMIQFALDFATTHQMIPVLMQKSGLIVGKDRVQTALNKQTTCDIQIVDNNATNQQNTSNSIIFQINRKNLNDLAKNAIALLDNSHILNIVIQDMDQWNTRDVNKYERELIQISTYIREQPFTKKTIQVNVLTDTAENNSLSDCGSGTTSFALAPNGKFYACPAFYFNRPSESIGDINQGITIKNQHLFNKSHAHLCKACDSQSCHHCSYQNRQATGELCIPGEIQCAIKKAEKNATAILQSTKAHHGC